MKPGKELLFVALGGSGEIGMNANLYGCDGKWLLVDMGVSFGNAEYPGIDIIMPDLRFIEDRRADLAGIFITHGHEDHIGAVPYLAADLGVPVYANRFTASLIAGKLREEGLTGKVDLRIVDTQTPVEMGPFRVQFFQMAHSIPDMFAALIETPYGRVFHTGDWKLDADMRIGDQTPAIALQEIGREGIRAVVCDSTNVFTPTASGSEASVKDGLLKVVAEARGRVLVTTFASNAARLKILGEVARETGRQLCMAGRSLDRIIEVARSNGYLKDMPPLIDPDAAMSLPRHEVMIVATGGQGEPRAALARIAQGNHPVKLELGDRVIYSSRQIPGNELAIAKIMNALAVLGVEIVTERQAHVHVSGHPGRPELEALYGYLKPEIAVPVHGEIRHMMEHCRVAAAAGVPFGMFQTNGDIVRLAPGDPAIVGSAKTGRLILDGDVILPSDGETMALRRKLALTGQISVAVAFDRDGRLHGKPEVRYNGVPVEEERDAFIGDMVEAAAEAAAEPGRDRDRRREHIRLAVRRVANEWTGKKPIVDVLMIAL